MHCVAIQSGCTQYRHGGMDAQEKRQPTSSTYPANPLADVQTRDARPGVPEFGAEDAPGMFIALTVHE